VRATADENVLGAVDVDRVVLHRCDRRGVTIDRSRLDDCCWGEGRNQRVSLLCIATFGLKSRPESVAHFVRPPMYGTVGVDCTTYDFGAWCEAHAKGEWIGHSELRGRLVDAREAALNIVIADCNKRYLEEIVGTSNLGCALVLRREEGRHAERFDVTRGGL